MVQIHLEMEMCIVAAAVGAILSVVWWQTFRCELNGEKSLFLKMFEPYDDKIQLLAAVPLLVPSYTRRGWNDAHTNHTRVLPY